MDAAHRWWTLAATAVGGPRGGKLPSNGTAFFTADGSSNSRDATRSPGCMQTSFLMSLPLLDHETYISMNIEADYPCLPSVVLQARNKQRKLARKAYQHGGAFCQSALDCSRGWSHHWHAHFHDLDFSKWDICLYMAPISHQVSKQLAGRFSNESGGIMVILQLTQFPLPVNRNCVWVKQFTKQCPQVSMIDMTLPKLKTKLHSHRDPYLKKASSTINKKSSPWCLFLCIHDMTVLIQLEKTVQLW